MIDNNSSYCKSCFLNSETALTKEHFTQVWINLINQIEKSKDTVATI